MDAIAVANHNNDRIGSNSHIDFKVSSSELQLDLQTLVKGTDPIKHHVMLNFNVQLIIISCSPSAQPIYTNRRPYVFCTAVSYSCLLPNRLTQRFVIDILYEFQSRNSQILLGQASPQYISALYTDTPSRTMMIQQSDHYCRPKDNVQWSLILQIKIKLGQLST